MSPSVEQLKVTLSNLADAERAELAHYLLQSLEPAESEDGVDQAWRAELTRRMEEIRSGKVVGVPVEQVLGNLREKYT